MTGEWIASAVLAAIMSLVLWLIQRSMTRQERKIDCVGDDLKAQGKEHGAALTEIKIGLRDCVKWTDLERELGPVRGDVREHDRRLTVVETTCTQRHKVGQ